MITLVGILLSVFLVAGSTASEENLSKYILFEQDALAAESDELIASGMPAFKAFSGVALVSSVHDSTIECKVYFTQSGVEAFRLVLRDDKPVRLASLSDLRSIVTLGNIVLIHTGSGALFKGTLNDHRVSHEAIECQLFSRELYFRKMTPINDSAALVTEFSMGKSLPRDRGELTIVDFKNEVEETFSYPTTSGQILNSNRPFSQISVDSNTVYFIDAITYEIFTRRVLPIGDSFTVSARGELMPYPKRFYEKFDTLRGVVNSTEMLKALDSEKTLEGQSIVSCFFAHGMLFVCKRPYEPAKKSRTERLWDVWSVEGKKVTLLKKDLSDVPSDNTLVTNENHWLGGEHFEPIAVGDRVYSVRPFSTSDDIRLKRTKEESKDNMAQALYSSDVYRYYLSKCRVNVEALRK